ncbi:hypothetical protein [Croceicoccus naphthovorans]|uniref:Uncharacterized protein n=1 Tax=Croceicoccus naphthovorans TaxID=1348774 RepID=A0A0G3XK36_9SPHN|nr:hypothetical protein [Croceicoccus naphthovorans]AKM10743.1 hypothetical protein AB433_13445 [Croceicoccus naphthovorans]MBB3988928.1 hypothetical protein [Croceicoccus naphthovorans]
MRFNEGAYHRDDAPGMKMDHHFKQLMRLRISKPHGCAIPQALLEPTARKSPLFAYRVNDAQIAV